MPQNSKAASLCSAVAQADSPQGWSCPGKKGKFQSLHTPGLAWPRLLPPEHQSVCQIPSSTTLAVAPGGQPARGCGCYLGVAGQSPWFADSRPWAGGRYIEVFREKNVPAAKGPMKSSAQPWQGRTLGENEEEEDLADSGRLFVRNLPYTSTEEDLEKLFSKYGRGATWRRSSTLQVEQMLDLHSPSLCWSLCRRG